MKHIVIKLLIFLLLGAVVTVAVAWGCAIAPWKITTLPPGEEARAPELAWMTELGWRLPDEHDGWTYSVEALRFTRVGTIHVRYSQCPEPARYSNFNGFYSYWHFADTIDAGWPLRCLRGRAMQASATGGAQTRDDLRALRTDPTNERLIGALRMPNRPQSTWYGGQLVPCHPTTAGFLLNTLFYALVLWLLWSTPFTTRRLIRKRRGRCIKCGYDLRGAKHDACPECGGAG